MREKLREMLHPSDWREIAEKKTKKTSVASKKIVANYVEKQKIKIEINHLSANIDAWEELVKVLPVRIKSYKRKREAKVEEFNKL